MVAGMAGESGIRTAEARRLSRDNIRTEWAEQQYSRALAKLALVAPVRSLKGLGQGDVLVSKSGNVRLVLAIEPVDGDARVKFLSRPKSGGLTIEQAGLNRIDCGRLEAAVVRRSGNPLARFSDLAAELGQDGDIGRNVATLLHFGPDGERLTGALMLARRDQLGFVRVRVGFSAARGSIQAIGEESGGSGLAEAELLFNGLRLPAEDYISTVTFFGGAAPAARTGFLASCVLANTIENARNLIHMAHMAQL